MRPSHNVLLRLALLAALAVGIALRTVQFSQIPPGLYRDQAYHGMDALDTLQGNVRLFYDTNFGREPLYIWLTAISVGILGASPIAVRFPSLIVGILTLFTCYKMAAELYGRRVGVLATAVFSITLWHIHFSRLGFRAILIPLFASLSVWLVARGVRTGEEWYLALGGAAAGALIYTYISARAAILPAALFVLYVWYRRRSFNVPTKREWLIFTLSATVVMAPFLVYTALHWDEVFLRIKVAVSVFNNPQPIKMLFTNTLGALGMFLFRGDFLSRHNVPYRPVFDPAVGLMFCLGLWLAISRFKRDYASAFLLIWTVSMLIPTILTEDCPHFIRGIGVLPFITLFPALGLDWTWDNLRPRLGVSRAVIVLSAVLLAGLGSTIWAYFIRYPTLPETCYRFECAGVEMASEINAYLDKGWTEGMWIVPDRPGRTDRQVFVQLQLWKDVVNAHYLIPDSPGFNVPGASDIISVPPRPDLPMLYYGWYNKNFPDFWMSDLMAWLPPNSLIEVYEGPWAITHQDWSPHPAYIKFAATPKGAPSSVLAELDQGISLVSSCTLQRDGQVTVRLIWYNRLPVELDYHVFLHYERNGEIIAQADGPLGKGYYPPSKWRPGDQFLDERSLPIPEILEGDRIWVGMYLWQTGERLPVLTATTANQDNRIAVNLQRCDD